MPRLRRPLRVVAALTLLGTALALASPAGPATADVATAPATARETAAAAAATTSTELPLRPLTARAGCRRTCFGAISVNPRTGIAYEVHNTTTRAAAVKRAQRTCRTKSAEGRCFKVVWVRNGCAAVAARVQREEVVEWAGRAARTERGAVRQAKRAVRGPGTVRKWIAFCTAVRR
ncbi:DUF4189 domain-containing protein [Nocardioides sp. GY 10113]|uniref:DUF4189 domain-containing protein n=1 Tax=Nocardioides sp. GY 10113 TaxID=2569761 RepID=UPI0010A775FC|nr:DUF4189 domain-containing protein [Nocardioides sp. GY 10113]TIC88753.1 DUF4189 domain-containing protein [Nocardioides sp. GY 10113]